MQTRRTHATPDAPDGTTDRRSFLRSSMLLGSGVLAASALGSGTVLAQQAPSAPAAAPAAKPPALTYAQVMNKARELMYPICRVCPECDGIACAGEVPGMGGIGSGNSFKNNFRALQRVQLKLRTAHAVSKPDPSIMLFGHKIALPAVGAPTGGTTYNMGAKMTEDGYVEAVIGGCAAAGTVGSVADGIGDPVETYERRLKKLTELGLKAIASVKPRTQEEIIARMKKAEAAGAIAISMDIDSAGRAARALPGQTVEPKDVAKLRELVKATKLPFIVKGLMTVDEALQAVEAGAAAIVVSNHGGRVLDHTPGTAEALPAVAEKVKGKVFIFVDGTVKYGHDVLKYVALGADAVMVGRHIVRGAHGGGRQGVALVMSRMRQELVDAMVLTGCADAKSIGRHILV
jgi:isopentenyl diphosphate isomerase/L-lactate dehydrogenase-like FMN-dependent dehydrogenase